METIKDKSEIDELLEFNQQEVDENILKTVKITKKRGNPRFYKGCKPGPGRPKGARIN